MFKKNYTTTLVTYNYLTSSDNTKTNELISKYTTQINGGTPKVYSYTYDARGNITSIKLGSAEKYRYVYDDQNQLIREDNVDRSATYVYNYDDSGNILSIKTYPLTAKNATPSGSGSTINYGYSSSSTWGDRLVSYMGRSISYDAIGNPLNYYNGTAYTFTWQGRQLKSASMSGKTMSFTYNDEGIRTSKTVNGVTTTYYLNGSRIIGEATSEYLILYLYDAEGSPIGMEYYSIADDTWQTYLYEKNLQGDIVSVYTESGLKLVTYTYDAWGSFTTKYYENGSSTAAALNPFRYRGYYFDLNLRLYYLNSRYYDCLTRRFVNADIQISDDLLGKNLYVYCGNNPITRTDDTGEGWFRAVCGAIGGFVSGTAKVISNAISGKKLSSGVIGAFAGGFVGTYIGTFGNLTAASYAGAAVESAINEIVSYTSLADFNGTQQKELTLENAAASVVTILQDTVANGTIAYVSSSIVKKIMPTNINYNPETLKQFIESSSDEFIQASTNSGISLGFEMLRVIKQQHRQNLQRAEKEIFFNPVKAGVLR